MIMFIENYEIITLWANYTKIINTRNDIINNKKGDKKMIEKTKQTKKQIARWINRKKQNKFNWLKEHVGFFN